MPDVKIDDNGLFEEERRLNVYLNTNKLEQLENQHVEMDERWVTDSWPVYHELKPRTAEDPPCRGDDAC
ncbi:hypothetical protein TNCV_4173161 [Trichonephila clavipes]|nr:hypothetical protein TNCV_4173161 [Trichonephila clavipes]